MSCKEHDCKESHCVSSRYVLSHYSKCKEKECPVCGPVREAIRRNYEKSSTKVCRVPNRVLYAFSGSPPLHPASLNCIRNDENKKKHSCEYSTNFDSFNMHNYYKRKEFHSVHVGF